MRKVVDMINYEIEYVLRPVSAPIRWHCHSDVELQTEIRKDFKNAFMTLNTVLNRHLNMEKWMWNWDIRRLQPGEGTIWVFSVIVKSFRTFVWSSIVMAFIELKVIYPWSLVTLKTESRRGHTNNKWTIANASPGLRPAGPSCAPTAVPAAPGLTSVAGAEEEGAGGQCTRGGTMAGAGAGDTLASSTGPPASTTWPPGPPAGDITLSTQYLQYLCNIFTISAQYLRCVGCSGARAPAPQHSPVARPRTAPHRSPTRPHYKEEVSIIYSIYNVYTVSTVSAQYLQYLVSIKIITSIYWAHGGTIQSVS